MRRPTLALTALLTLAVAAPAGAVEDLTQKDNVIVAPPNAISTGFAPDQISIIQGERLSFTNLDPAVHDVTIAATDEDGHEIFRSEQITASESARRAATPVDNVDRLPAGTYNFFCSVHNSGTMRGTLTVEPRVPKEEKVPVVLPRQQVIAGPAAVTTNYLTPELVIRQGDGLDMLNLDQVFHTATSDDVDDDNIPLFDTSAPGFNRTSPVQGVERLAPGEYRFHCFFHSTLRGRLTVTAGAPPARLRMPGIRLDPTTTRGRTAR